AEARAGLPQSPRSCRTASNAPDDERAPPAAALRAPFPSRASHPLRAERHGESASARRLLPVESCSLARRLHYRRRSRASGGGLRSLAESFATWLHRRGSKHAVAASCLAAAKRGSR